MPRVTAAPRRLAPRLKRVLKPAPRVAPAGRPEARGGGWGPRTTIGRIGRPRGAPVWTVKGNSWGICEQQVGRLSPRCPPLKMVTTSASTPSWASMLWDAELHALARPVQPLGPDTTIRSGVGSMSSSARSSSIERHDEKVSPAGIEARRTSKSAQTPPRRPCHGTALSCDAGV